jgi:hypothetical protein
LIVKSDQVNHSLTWAFEGHPCDQKLTLGAHWVTGQKPFDDVALGADKAGIRVTVGTVKSRLD